MLKNRNAEKCGSKIRGSQPDLKSKEFNPELAKFDESFKNKKPSESRNTCTNLSILEISGIDDKDLRNSKKGEKIFTMGDLNLTFLNMREDESRENISDLSLWTNNCLKNENFKEKYTSLLQTFSRTLLAIKSQITILKEDCKTQIQKTKRLYLQEMKIWENQFLRTKVQQIYEKKYAQQKLNFQQLLQQQKKKVYTLQTMVKNLGQEKKIVDDENLRSKDKIILLQEEVRNFLQEKDSKAKNGIEGGKKSESKVFFSKVENLRKSYETGPFNFASTKLLKPQTSLLKSLGNQRNYTSNTSLNDQKLSFSRNQRKFLDFSKQSSKKDESLIKDKVCDKSLKEIMGNRQEKLLISSCENLHDKIRDIKKCLEEEKKALKW